MSYFYFYDPHKDNSWDPDLRMTKNNEKYISGYFFPQPDRHFELDDKHLEMKKRMLKRIRKQKREEKQARKALREFNSKYNILTEVTYQKRKEKNSVKTKVYDV